MHYVRSKRFQATRFISTISIAVATFSGSVESANGKESVSPELRAESLATLRSVMQTQERWVKVHAAEWLLALGYPEGVVEEFRRELSEHGEEPEYRIGIWRVLSKVPQSPSESAEWLAKIKEVFQNEDSPDRTHAAETLAKLQAELSPKLIASAKLAAKGGNHRLAGYSTWLLFVADKEHRDEHLRNLLALLKSPQMESRQIASYALRHIGPVGEGSWKQLVEFAQEESDALLRLRLYGAALVTAPPSVERSTLDQLRTKIMLIAAQENGKFDNELIQILAAGRQPIDLVILEKHLRAEPVEERDALSDAAIADLNAAAAYAILRIGQRN